MTVRNRIIETAAGLLAKSADVDISTRAICDAAGVTAPTLYHHFGDKDGLLAAVVDFGWATFLETKLAVAAVVHDHVADDIRAGWDNHLEFARENPSFYKLMWSPAVAASSSAVREAYQMLYDRLELGAGRGQLRVSVEAASRIVLSATTGAALSLISQPDLYGDGTFATQLREAVIAWITVPQGTLSSAHGPEREAEPTIASAAATLSSRLTAEETALTGPETALMQQWLTTLADTPPAARPATPRRPRGSGKEASQ
jgi:AcrR family transcriptional regulator